MGVAVGGFHLKNAVADFQNRDIESTAAEVVNRNSFFALLVEAVSQRGRGRLVDDAEHFEARDLAGVLGRLTLAVVEVGRNGDHRLGDLLAEIGFRIGLELLQDHRGDFRRRIIVVANLHMGVAVGGFYDLIRHELALAADFRELAAHQALDRENRILRVGDGLTLRGLADQTLTGLGERDDGRGGPVAFRIRDHLEFSVLHHSHAAVGGAEVNT